MRVYRRMIVGFMAILVGAFMYAQHPFKVYDSSLDGSEILEAQQSTIPLDVQKNLEMQQLLAWLESQK